jgi:hypothetical protein
MENIDCADDELKNLFIPIQYPDSDPEGADGDGESSESQELPLTASAMGLHLSDTPSPDPVLYLERQPSRFTAAVSLQSEAGERVSEEKSMSLESLDTVEKIVFPGGFSKKSEDIANPDIMPLIGLARSDSNSIYVSNTEEHLSMFYFRDDCINKHEAGSPVLAVRGWIVDCSIQSLICCSFTEGAVCFLDSKRVSQLDWMSYEFTPYIEGSSVRAFWDGKQWRYAAHRKIDSRKSRIPGVEVELFVMLQNAWPEFKEEDLDINYIYVFVIVDRDNQIMNPDPIERARVFHLATIRSIFAPAENGIKTPFLIEDCGGLDPRYRLRGAFYLQKLTLEEACQLYLDKGRSVVARSGYNLIQVAPPQTVALMLVRGVDQAPHVPPELMWMRLEPENRPLLVNAVPFHQKEAVACERMQSYVSKNIELCSQFCAEVLISKLGGVKYHLSKTLNFVMKQVVLNGQTRTKVEIAKLYAAKFWDMLDTNGSTLYRCFKDVESAKAKMQKLGVIQLVPDEPVRTPKNFRSRERAGRPREGGGRKDGGGKRDIREGGRKDGGRQPQIKGNVTIKEGQIRAKGRIAPAPRQIGKNGGGKAAVEVQDVPVEIRQAPKAAKGSSALEIIESLK